MAHPPVAEGANMQEQTHERAPMIVVKPPGPRSRELLAKQSKLETKAVIYPKAFPFAIDSANGATVKDVDGNLYIDWVSGVSVLNLGHRNPYVEEAVRSQLGKVWHALEIPNETRIAFLERIHSVLPPGIKAKAKVLLTVTGGDSVEAAVSVAKRGTGKRTIVAFEGAYHGVHQGGVSLTASSHYLDYAGASRQAVLRPPYPYSARFALPVYRKGAEANAGIGHPEHRLRDARSGVADIASSW